MSHHGRVYFNELNTWDPDAAKTYYGAVFGWSFVETPTAGTDNQRPYHIAKIGDDVVAGMFTMVSPHFDGIPDHWFTYLAVDDLDAAIKTSDSAGGKVTRPPFVIPDFGRMAVVAGPTGAYQAFFQPADD
ncbi:MAG: VOC family protein [Pseudomonadota bacterium]